VASLIVYGQLVEMSAEVSVLLKLILWLVLMKSTGTQSQMKIFVNVSQCMYIS
jgi:hypothetical protein